MAGKKKTPSAQYAFIGLILALIACVSTGLIGAAKGMLAIKMFTLENTRWTQPCLADQHCIAHRWISRIRDHGT